MMCLCGDFSDAAIHGQGSNVVDCAADVLRLLGANRLFAGADLGTSV